MEMVARVQCLVAVVALLLHVSASVLGLNCNEGERAQTSLVAFEKGPCNIFGNIDLQYRAAMKLTAAQKRDLIQTCSCALLNSKSAWTSMMTSNAEALFKATKKLINETDLYTNNGKDKKFIEESGMAKEQFVARSGENADRQFYWDRLHRMTRDKYDEVMAHKIIHKVRIDYAEYLNDPSSTTPHPGADMEYNSLKVTDGVKNSFTAVCREMIESFFPFVTHLGEMSRFVNNPSLFFQLTTQSDDLYKLGMNTRLCKFLEDSKRLMPVGMEQTPKIRS